MNKSLSFWLSLLFLNVLLFLPAFLLNMDSSSFLPSTSLEAGGSTGKLLIFFARDNQDLFRMSADLLLLTMGLFLLRNTRFYGKWLLWAVSAVFLLLLYYQFYYAVSLKLYGQHPYFKNDLVLAAEVLPIFLGQFSQGSNMGYIASVIGFLMVSVLAVLLVRVMYRSLPKVALGRWGWALGIAALGILALFTYKNLRSTYPPIYNTLQWTSPKVLKSARQQNADRMKSLPWLSIYRDYLNKPLEQKPNIYVIFVESYGECMYTKERLQDRYLTLIRSLDQRLDSAGWKSASVFSESPILGGRSWLGFGSAFSGIKIEDQLQFNDLLEYQPDYPHFIRYLKAQGYETFRLKTMSDKQSTTKADYEPTDRYFGFDRWLKHADIPYSGYKYDHFGGIPDQYALNYFREEVPKDSTRPHFLFSITMSSHGPWFPAPPVYEDWRMLDTIKKMPHDIEIPDTVSYRFDALLEANIWDRYFDAEKYELEYLTQFVVQQGTDKDLFVFVGDHQPPMLTGYGMDELYTPMHIISRDSALIKGFEAYGFNSGMEILPPFDKHRIKHESFYPMMLRELLRNYGAPGVELPRHLPNGLQ